MSKSDGGGAFYGFGFVGALFYFLQQASSFVDFLVAIFKAIFWPGFVVYHLLKFLGI